MIRWTFFFNEGNVKSEITEEKEDLRITESLENPSERWLELPGLTTNLHVNLDLVKVIAREIVDESQEELVAIQSQDREAELV